MFLRAMVCHRSDAGFDVTAHLFPLPTGIVPPIGRLIAAGREVTGFLDGEIGEAPAGWYRRGAQNGEALAALFTALKERYPEAGEPLWAVRLWTNLLWQPAYLLIAAVHELGAVPALDAMSQQRKGADIAAYRFAQTELVEGSVTELIARAGTDLRAFADDLLIEINGLTRLKKIPALRLLTDRMLGAMVFLHRRNPDLPIATIRDWCGQWLAAMGLVGHGDLETLRAPDGRDVLFIARKGCCLDYLVTPGVYCSSCPKQPEAVRLARQHAEALQ